MVVGSWIDSEVPPPNLRAQRDGETDKEYHIFQAADVKNITNHKQALEAATDAYRERRRLRLITLFLYIEKTWVTPHRCRYIDCFVDCTHFGHTTSSRGEGAHAQVKGLLAGSTGDLLTVFGALEKALCAQLDAHENAESSSIKRKPLCCSGATEYLYSAIVGEVSHFAIKMVHNQYKIMGSDDGKRKECTNHFTKTWGIPCSHHLRQRLAAKDEARRRLLVDDFHIHWHLGVDKPLADPDVEAVDVNDLSSSDDDGDQMPGDPDKVQGKGRKRKDFEKRWYHADTKITKTNILSIATTTRRMPVAGEDRVSVWVNDAGDFIPATPEFSFCSLPMPSATPSSSLPPMTQQAPSSSVQSTASSRRCANCGTGGHYEKTCKQACSRCAAQGHTVKQCTIPKAKRSRWQ